MNGKAVSALLGSRRAQAAFAVGAVVAILYAPLVRNGFVWDDWTLVASSGVLDDASGLVRALTSDLYRANAAAGPSGYWRPLAALSFWLNSLLDSAPWALHAGNVALHAVTSGLFALLLARAFGERGLVAAGLAACLWAIHPEQVESVAWISCRYELLTGLVAVASLLVPKRATWGSALATGGLFLAGLLSKESFVAFAAVIAADDWAARRSWRDSMLRWIACAIAFAAWFTARRLLGIEGIDAGASTLLAFPERFLAAVAVYAVRLFAPLPLSIHKPFAPTATLVAVGGAIVAASIVLAWRRRTLAPPIALFLASLAPTSIAMGRLEIAAERYFYVPSLGLAWLLGAALCSALCAREKAVRYAATGIPVAALVAMVPVTFGRFEAWRSDDALFTSALEVDPSDSYAHLYLGRRALQAGELERAGRHLAAASERDPSSAEAADALAELQLRLGIPAAARAYAQKAVELEPAFTQAWLHLSWAAHALGDHRAELAAADRAAALAPDFVPARVTAVLARCEVDRTRACESGLDDLARSGRMSPDVELIARATAALRRGDAMAASERVEQLRRAMPEHPQIAQLQAQLDALRPR